MIMIIITLLRVFHVSVSLSCPVKNVNKLDHSKPLKTQRSATTGNDKIIRSPNPAVTTKKGKKMFTTQQCKSFESHTL